MTERKINLEEILDKYINEKLTIREFCLLAMKDACLQTLELAAENANTKSVNISYKGYGNITEYEGITVVDKQSILDTINQIE